MKIPKEYTDYLESGGKVEFETTLEFGGYIILEPLKGLEEFNKE